MAGNVAGPLVLLLLLLAGAGGFNYHRNLELQRADEAQKRPFESYGDADLEALAGAYRAEIADWKQRYASATSRGRGPAQPGGLIGERVDDFERVQRRTTVLRDIKGEVATREHRLAEIELEQQKRAADPTGFARHWKLLVSL